MANQTDDQRDEPRRKSWHLDKSISLAHIISTIVAVSAVIAFGSKMDTRLSLVEQAVALQSAIDKRQDVDGSELRRQMREDMRDIATKLDRLIERQK